jgi:hypothetical protein
MASKYEIRRFRKFLRKHKSLELYKINFRNRDAERSLLGFLNTLSAQSLLYSAFNWSATPENTDYWRNLNDQWLKIADAEEQLIKLLLNKGD